MLNNNRENENVDNTNDKNYWNEYVTYWENKVKEANEEKKVKDQTNNDRVLETYYKKMNVKKDEIFLDYGCGSGRLYGIYNKEDERKNNYFGIDISGVCLEHAKIKYKELKIGGNLAEFDGIHIPFEDNFFDKIMCFGVFDACNQEIVIQELFRVLKTDGILLVTGKNNKYFEDDEDAFIAEVNARKKGHPNYFTDVYNFVNQLQQHNVKILEEYYFLRRGDFPKNQAICVLPERFYEWALLVKKTKKYMNYEYEKFSYKYSNIKGTKKIR